MSRPKEVRWPREVCTTRYINASSDEVSVVPSTIMVKVPVGVVVLELESEATLIVMVSLAPGAGW